MLGCGGGVAADRVPVPGGLLRAEPAGDFLLHFGWAQVAFGVVGCGRYAQVVHEAQHVAGAVAEAFEQVAAGVLLAAGAAGDLRQPGQHTVPETVDERGSGLGGDGGQALIPGLVGGVDQPAQRIGDLARPDRVLVALGGVGKIT